LPTAQLHRFYQARIQTSASIGHLVSADEDGKSYQLRFRTGDDLVFTLNGAPDGLSIDNSGLISGFIQSAQNRDYSLTVTVKNKTNGATDSAKLLLKIAAND